MCGDCCKGYGGTFVTQKDIEAISEHLQISPTSFLADYCQWSGKRPVIKTGSSGYCVFWDKVCTIHQIKPRMCKLWPFIASVLVDPSNWAAMQSVCPGIQKKVNHKELANFIRHMLAEYNSARFNEGLPS